MVNPTWLKTFVSLADTGHFSRTADKLAMTQPGVTQHIHKLEDYYQVCLLERYGKRFELTEAGQQVLKFARHWLQAEGELKTELTDVHPHSGHSTIGSPGALGLKLYPLIVDLQCQHSDLVVDYEFAPNVSLHRQVEEAKLDWALVNSHSSNPLIECQQIGEEELCLVTQRNTNIHHWQDIEATGFINHPDGFQYANQLLSCNFSGDFRHAEQLKISGYVNHIGLILAPVAKGIGFTVLPYSAIAGSSFHQQVKIQKLNKPVYEPVYLIYRHHRTLPARDLWLMEKIRRACKVSARSKTK